MAIGDDATDAGYPLVPNTGEDGRVRYGAREINRTRDFVAQVKELIPVGTGGFQEATGIVIDVTDPVDADGRPDGTIFYKVLST